MLKWLVPAGICVSFALGMIGCSDAPPPATEPQSSFTIEAPTIEAPIQSPESPAAVPSPVAINAKSSKIKSLSSTMEPTSVTPVELQKKLGTASRKLRYLALGDSYTIGQSVDVSERWPVQLVERLRGANVNIGDPEIIARTGWTTGDLTRGIDVAGPVGPFDIVTLSIGVNNQYRGLDIKQYRKEFTALLKIAVALAGDRPSHVIVVSIPDWGATPFAGGLDRRAIAQEIDQFNIIKSEETDRFGVAYIDVTGISRKAETEPDLIAADGLHPSGIMYNQWVDRILPPALAISTSASRS